MRLPGLANDWGITRRPVFGRPGACPGYAGSSVCEKPFIFFVGPDPEPDDLIRRSLNTDGTVTPADPDRNEAIRSMNLLEPETRVPRVLHESTIGGARLTTNVIR